MSESPDQQFCRTHAWGCPCHSMPRPPWPSGDRPALRCPVCDHPDLAVKDMDSWWAAKSKAPGGR